MRAILVLVGLAAIVLVVLMSLGMVSVQQTANGSFPTVRFEGGKAPEFKANVGKVDVGTVNKTIEVPTVRMENKTVQMPAVTVQRADNAAATAQ